MKSEYQVGKGKIELAQGSITRYHADALVCPANGDLEIVAFPGGLQYAFLIEGGEEIFREAQKVAAEYYLSHPDMIGIVGVVPKFSAHITRAGRLPAKYVIHSVAVGLNNKGLYCNGNVIATSTKNVLDLAKERELKSVGFPALGTGLYEVPLDDAVEAMTEEFKKHLQNETSIERLGLVLYSPDDYFTGKAIIDKKFY